MGGLQRRQHFTGRPQPAIAKQIAQRRRGITVHHYLRIVKRPVFFALRCFSVRILRLVLRGVPAILRQVDPAAKSDRVIDDHDLLVLRGTDGVFFVHLKRDARVSLPWQRQDRQPLAFGDIDHRPVPHQHVDPQIPGATDGSVQEFAE